MSIKSIRVDLSGDLTLGRVGEEIIEIIYVSLLFSSISEAYAHLGNYMLANIFRPDFCVPSRYSQCESGQAALSRLPGSPVCGLGCPWSGCRAAWSTGNPAA